MTGRNYLKSGWESDTKSSGKAAADEVLSSPNAQDATTSRGGRVKTSDRIKNNNSKFLRKWHRVDAKVNHISQIFPFDLARQ